MRDVRALKQKIETTKEELVDTLRLFPNRWNFNEQQTHVFKAVVESVKRYGNRLYPIIVREIGSRKYEIIDGEHRWKAARELGLKKVYIKNLGRIDDVVAEELTLLLNEDRGESDMLKLAELVEEAKAGFGEADVKGRYPFTDAELRDLELFSKINWEEFPVEWQERRKQTQEKRKEVGCEHEYVEEIAWKCQKCGLVKPMTEEEQKLYADKVVEDKEEDTNEQLVDKASEEKVQ